MRMLKGIVCATFIVILGSCVGFSEMEVKKGDERPFEKLQPINAAAKKLAIGYGVGVGVKADGTVWSWGTADNGELGSGERNDQKLTPYQIPDLTDFVEIAGRHHFLVLRKDGTVWSWGSNESGQLGYDTPNPAWGNRYSAAPRVIPGLKNIVSVAAGLSHSLALDGRGNVFAFGSNDNLQLGLQPEDKGRHVAPRLAITIPDAVKVMAGAGKSAVLTRTGEVFYWGDNSGGHVVAKDDVKEGTGFHLLPMQLNTPALCSDFVLGGTAVYCLSVDGFIWARGLNNVGNLGQGDRAPRDGFLRVKNIGRIVSVVTDGLSASALDESGVIWQWGSYVRWRPNAGVNPVNVEPYPIRRPTINAPETLYGGGGNAVFSSDGSVYFWGWSRQGNRGTGKPSEEYQSAENWMGPELSSWKWK